MSQIGREWLTRILNAMTTLSTDHEVLLTSRRQGSEANGPSLLPEELTNASRTLSNPKRAHNPAKTRITVTLPGTLLDRLRNAVFWTADLTIAGLIEQAVTDSLDRLEHQHGDPFPPRVEELRVGRPRRVRSEPSQG